MTESVMMTFKTARRKAWDAVRGRYALVRGLDRPEQTLIVTGIPRSGTSLLCSLLNRVPDVVCFNEIFYDVPGLLMHLNRARRDLILGNPVPNKFDSSGQVASDTMDGARIRQVALTPMSEEVVVATNVNVPYLRKLGFLRRLGCPIVAVVRDPACTIASWRSEHTASIPEATVGLTDDRVHARWKGFSFSSCEPTERYAELWDYLARLIIDSGIDVISYESVVIDPNAAVGALLSKTGNRSPVPPLTGVRNGNERYSAEELADIRQALVAFAPNRGGLGYA